MFNYSTFFWSELTVVVGATPERVDFGEIEKSMLVASFSPREASTSTLITAKILRRLAI